MTNTDAMRNPSGERDLVAGNWIFMDFCTDIGFPCHPHLRNKHCDHPCGKVAGVPKKWHYRNEEKSFYVLVWI